MLVYTKILLIVRRFPPVRAAHWHNVAPSSPCFQNQLQTNNSYTLMGENQNRISPTRELHKLKLQTYDHRPEVSHVFQREDETEQQKTEGTKYTFMTPTAKYGCPDQVPNSLRLQNSPRNVDKEAIEKTYQRNTQLGRTGTKCRSKNTANSISITSHR